jgi:hypothetical protein
MSELYIFYNTVFIVAVNQGWARTSLSGNSCSWAAQGGGGGTGWDSNLGLDINSHRVRMEPGTGLQHSSVLTTELRRTSLSYAAPHMIELYCISQA